MDTEREVPVVDCLPWLMKTVPTDLNELASGQKKCMDQIGDALMKFGCFKLQNSDLVTSELDAAETFLENFFRLPLDEKKKYKYMRGNQFGYVEIGNTRTQQGYSAMVEAFIFVTPLMEAKDWPEKELPGVTEQVLEIMTSFKEQCKKLVQLVAMSLNKMHNDLVKQAVAEDNNKFCLRINHYPSTMQDDEDNASVILFGEHSDESLLTIVSGKQLEGLQILLESGEWVDVACSPGDYFVNAGNLLTIWTAGKIPAVKHRVIKPAKKFKSSARMSLAFFFVPGDDVTVENIYSDPKYPPILVKEFVENVYKTCIK